MPRRYGGPNGYGHKPDPEGHQRTDVRVMLARAGVDHTTIPDQASNREFGPGILHQRATSGCVGHAIYGAVHTTLGKAGTPLKKMGSPTWVYKVARAVDRRRGPDGKFPPLDDTGSSPNAAMRGSNEFGIASMGPSPDGELGDADPATVNDEPDLDDVEDASDFEIVGQYEIFPWDPNFIDLVCATLASGICVCFRIFCDTVGPRSVEGWDPSMGPLGATVNPTDEHGGGHYLYADGYRTIANRKRIIEWPNSWGQSWGKDGYGEGDESFVRGWSNVVAMKIRRKLAAAA